MFKFLPEKPNSEDCCNLAKKGTGRSRYSKTLLATVLTGVLLLSGCQQQAAKDNVADKPQTSEQKSEEDTQPMVQSDSAAARIEHFQPLYVTQFQRLQGRLQAEYESLQAADVADSANSLLVDEPTDAVETSNDQPVNSNTEVGKRDLTVLKRISLEPRKPIILTEEQIIERYEQAMEVLYQPVTTPLNAQDIDTLINIATLVPQLFEAPEIAGRVSAKSPALARLIIQHQVWEQIEAQQVLDMQKMKQNQQQEFEMLMAKFNETIEGYDEQIAKYEQTLKEFK
ncbi:hypothetical protein Psyc_0096 [Psychrobacter arcticus 273-4]|uniref:Uncharacterized protein n=1 Tax=Psychrobacter arcticus (strain DSM 17307 / VKM B-2377 / 273-4) TaxID=259536 RepID=Q4FVI8_PSYA2|nr:hypothetical protein [Psychrobacter arcticus]AAZ17970.1 hypothetical protein Psyc_0096 [Psychrobacter arcticus 273-4]